MQQDPRSPGEIFQYLAGGQFAKGLSEYGHPLAPFDVPTPYEQAKENIDAAVYAIVTGQERDLLLGWLARFHQALVTITQQSGQVCPKYYECRHPSCDGSYHAWAAATEALEEFPDKLRAVLTKP